MKKENLGSEKKKKKKTSLSTRAQEVPNEIR